MKKTKKAQGIWNSLWEQYKAEWKRLWNEYKTLIIPFITGTAKYAWHLIYGLCEMVIKGLYYTGKGLIEKLIERIKKA